MSLATRNATAAHGNPLPRRACGDPYLDDGSEGFTVFRGLLLALVLSAFPWVSAFLIYRLTP